MQLPALAQLLALVGLILLLGVATGVAVRELDRHRQPAAP